MSTPLTQSETPLTQPETPLGKSEPTLCLPYIYTNVTVFQLSKTLSHEIGFGTISKIERILKKNWKTGAEYNVVFVHFEEWATSESVLQIRKGLIAGKENKIYAEGSRYFWKVRAYVPKQPQPSPLDTLQMKARIE